MSREDDSVVHALAELCQLYQIKTLFQVGACDGYEAYAVASKTQCRVVLFEPDPLCAAMAPSLDWHAVMVGATDCVTTFYAHGARGLSSPIKRGDGEETEMQLRQTRLDTFCEKHEIWPDALLVDTEGTSLDVLEGCGDRILNSLKVAYLECQTSAFRPGMRLVGEVDALLVAHGMTSHQGPPSYGAGDAQGNYTFVRMAGK
jgi:FkbM family methyltransferase